jgi:hypothetical protein
MAKSFGKKLIEVSVILAEGDFGGGNTLVIPGGYGGLTMTVDVMKPGQPDQNKASVKVKGLSYDHMAELTTLGFRAQELQRNLISVKAGAGDSMTLIFEGEITEAWADFNAVPDVEMRIEAESGAYPQLIPEEPVSVDGEAAVSELMEKETKAMGYTFRNQGVTSTVRNAVFNGSPVAKLRSMAKQVDAELVIDDREVILLPGDGTPREGNAVLLSPESGLVGYPTFNQDGIVCKCLFNPDLRQAGLVEVKSLVPKASGTWKITRLSHKLSSDGQWLSEVEAEYVGG